MSEAFVTGTAPISERALAALLPQWRDSSRAALAEALTDPMCRGSLQPPTVERLSNSEGKNAGELIVDLLPVAQVYAHPPVSNFRVGAVALGLSGKIYFGANLEIPGQMLGFSVHAEQSAVANAFASRESGLTALAVTAAPCGHCRQFLNEIAGGLELELHIEGRQPVRLASLLPFSFGPEELGVTDRIFASRPWTLSSDTPADTLASAALDSARRSYAPYSRSPSGIAALTESQRIYQGSYLENVAFNPSLSPLQAALVGVVMGREAVGSIRRVALAEVERAAISQLGITRVVLQAVAPTAELEVVTARMAL